MIVMVNNGISWISLVTKKEKNGKKCGYKSLELQWKYKYSHMSYIL